MYFIRVDTLYIRTKTNQININGSISISNFNLMIVIKDNKLRKTFNDDIKKSDESDYVLTFTVLYKAFRFKKHFNNQQRVNYIRVKIVSTI